MKHLSILLCICFLSLGASAQAGRKTTAQTEKADSSWLLKKYLAAIDTLVLERDSLAKAAVADYALCGRLVDRDLEGFVRLLPKYYEAGAALPRHYREALVLYAHERRGSVPSLIGDLQSPAYEALNQEYEQLQQLLAQYAEDSERQLRLLENYRNTYWYYYSRR